ncbi:hypothetical protein COL8621_00978 [Actibacterium lipolyticum]|uniref:Uncharacterized protein n=1 Tax=Actibacterium lipolyticum TaxID=1524263 RepID=A0A238JTY7_9RHOB|nr:hypothetical protein COL8621_00978 [Actibacterium lipolyticum]
MWRIFDIIWHSVVLVPGAVEGYIFHCGLSRDGLLALENWANGIFPLKEEPVSRSWRITLIGGYPSPDHECKKRSAMTAAEVRLSTPIF